MSRFRLGYAVLVKRRPGAEIIPSEIGGNAENARLALSLGRARLQHCIVDADVFAFRVELAKSIFKIASSVGSGDLFEKRSRVGKMLAQRIG